MPKEKTIDFALAMKEKKVLHGFVTMAQTTQAQLDGEEPYVVVSCNYRRVIIYESELVPLPFKQSIVTYVGTDISFIIVAYDKETETVIASNKKAVENELKPTLDALYAGKALKGRIIHLVPHGAYITVNGVGGLMRNRDYADNGRTLREDFREGQPIVVKYKATSNRGTILFVPEHPIIDDNNWKISDFERGQVAIGRVVAVFPDRVYVNIAPRIDVMCRYPQCIANLQQEEMVKIRITKVDEEQKKIRGTILIGLNR